MKDNLTNLHVHGCSKALLWFVTRRRTRSVTSAVSSVMRPTWICSETIALEDQFPYHSSTCLAEESITDLRDRDELLDHCLALTHGQFYESISNYGQPTLLHLL